MWNTLIRGCSYSHDLQKQRAIEIYMKMLIQGLSMPDSHTFPFVLKACAYLFAKSEGQQVHGQLLKHGFDSDVYINNSLIHFYASCGNLEHAEKVFDKMPERSVVSWNAMVEGLVQLGEFDSALSLFRKMQDSFEPDGYMMLSVINACAGLRSLSLGMWAHAYISRNRENIRVNNDVLLYSSLVDMYCKCGSLQMAKQVFHSMNNHDVNSWNSIILGFASHGQGEAALRYFDLMINEGFNPNSITFVGVLSACNHRGFVDEGLKYFDRMKKDYGIEPVLEHYGCMVDLLARAGNIEKAIEIVLEMHIKPDVVIWRSLLDACCKNHADLDLSEEVTKQLLESDGGDCSGAYVLLSRVYASARRFNDVGLIRKLMNDNGVIKEPGCSVIEVDGISHQFFAGDTTHPETRLLYRVLREIEERLQKEGYEPDCSQASLVDDGDRGKAESLRLHSERLAIAMGLLNGKPGIPIRIFKNLRVCNDCHNVSKMISKVYNVEIVVRDRARFHHFKDGSCSCLDYW
ncbi:pentatricopeptide repeat-containing protein At1g59720, chloroplastic/mitochondrial isoform X2 [Impatiens glandulifera]|nr:pentatricopeptide repeat-containing protein At1g59720, chloroplastic/mitochondrial isoform X2 [Impatiens glandulifera]